MKSSIVALSLLGSMVFAHPLFEKRHFVTSVVLETATVTVTDSRSWKDWGRHTRTTKSKSSRTHRTGRPTRHPTATNTISIIDTTPSIVSTTVSTTSVFSSSTGGPSVSTGSVTLTSVSSAPPASTTFSSSTTPASTTSSSSAPPASTTSSSSNSPVSISAYADPILKQHNLHRSNHSAPDLVWNNTLADIAKEIASSCQYAHNTVAGGGGYGQNIGAGAPDNEVDQMITNQMYNDEIMLYPGYGSEPDMTDFERWGHFSQIVWKSTTSVGCYTQNCTGGLGGVDDNVSPYFTVCNYASPGNVAGQYADNVLAPRGDPVVIL